MNDRTTDTSAAVTASRLLAGYADENRTADLAAHSRRYGDLTDVLAQYGDPESLIDVVEVSGLVGHGGAGFPTGRKMRTVASQGARPVVVGNAMEGEPAAGKDEFLLSVAPHLVLDGLELAAAAVGADWGYVAVHRGSASAQALRHALAERPIHGHVEVVINELPAHYVSSEESALVHWLNGGEAKPLFVPPRPFERGVGGRPTLVNNAETLAHLALIARYGSEWFRSLGTVDEPGTLLVTISGSVADPGVREVAFGTTVGAALHQVGGPTSPLAAVLVGGYFGTWFTPEQALAMPLTHQAVRAAGGGLGAGILVALPVDACGIAETANVMTYLTAQSAAQCGPCVRGLPAIAGAIRDLAEGRLPAEGWGDLQRWLGLVAGRGACRHPDGAVRFAASALAVFANDVDQHRAGTPCAAHRAPTLPIGHPLSDWR